MSPEAPQPSPEAPQLSPEAPQLSHGAPQLSPGAPQLSPEAPQVSPGAPQLSPESAAVLGVSDEGGRPAVLQQPVSEVVQMGQPQLHQRDALEQRLQLAAVRVIALLSRLQLLGEEVADTLLVAVAERRGGVSEADSNVLQVAQRFVETGREPAVHFNPYDSLARHER